MFSGITGPRSGLPRVGLLAADSCQIRGRAARAQQTSAWMSTGKPFRCARGRFRMLLASLRVRDGRQSAGATPGACARDGSDPLLECLVRYREGVRCTCPSHLPREIAPDQQSLTGGLPRRRSEYDASLPRSGPCGRLQPRPFACSIRRTRSPRPQWQRWRAGRRTRDPFSPNYRRNGQQ